MTKPDVLNEWVRMTAPCGEHALYAPAKRWVENMLAGTILEQCELWLVSLRVVLEDEGPEALLNPKVMAALINAIRTDNVKAAGERDEYYSQELRGIIGLRHFLGQREYIERLQAVEREAGLSVYDGFMPAGQWQADRPVHPGLLRDSLDLLPPKYHAATAHLAIPDTPTVPDNGLWREP